MASTSARSVKVDMKLVKARKDEIVTESREGVSSWIEGVPNATVYRGQVRFTGPKTVSVNGAVLEADKIVINTAAARSFSPSLGSTAFPISPMRRGRAARRMLVCSSTNHLPKLAIASERATCHTLSR